MALLYNQTDYDRELLYQFENSTVFRQLTSGVFKGNVRIGNTVQVWHGTRMSASNYTPGSDFTAQTLNGQSSNLSINKLKSQAFTVDDVDELFSTPGLMAQNLAQWGNGFAQALDIDIATEMSSSAAENSRTITLDTSGSKAETGITNLTAKAELVYDGFLRLGVQLDSTGAPRQNRFIVADPADIKLAKLYINTTSGVGDGIARTGFAGTLDDGTVIYSSNNIQGTSATKRFAIAGVRSATTLADTFTGVKIQNLVAQHGVQAKALYVYGVKTFVHTGIAMLVHTFA
jgi:hypothetical protein